MSNQGIKNEYDFIKEINNKRVHEQNILVQDLIKYLFPKSTKNLVVKCYKNVEYEKGDICLKIGARVKYISIKMGIRNSVHAESIEKFIKFLMKQKVKDNVIIELLKYHYADGTIDGTGITRMNSLDYKKDNFENIQMINLFFNNEKLISKLINRFIIQGTQKHSKKIDALIYGVPSDFFWITPEDIYKYILKKKDLMSSAIHFSCLTYQPMSRVLDYNEKMEYKRHWIQIKWYNLEDNIIELLNMKTMNII